MNSIVCHCGLDEPQHTCKDCQRPLHNFCGEHFETNTDSWHLCTAGNKKGCRPNVPTVTVSPTPGEEEAVLESVMSASLALLVQALIHKRTELFEAVPAPDDLQDNTGSCFPDWVLIYLLADGAADDWVSCSEWFRLRLSLVHNIRLDVVAYGRQLDSTHEFELGVPHTHTHVTPPHTTHTTPHNLPGEKVPRPTTAGRRGVIRDASGKALASR
jgi:hypothetical protein